MQQETLSCRRRADGSIDYDHYRREASRLRAESISAAICSALHAARRLLTAAAASTHSRWADLRAMLV
jgi:hypothetical protein